MTGNFFDQFNVVKILGSVITNACLITLILLGFIVLVIYFDSNRKAGVSTEDSADEIKVASYKLTPTRLQVLQETIYSHFLGLVKDSTGETLYFAFIVTLFTFIAGVNLLGLLPHVFTPAAHIVVTFGMSFSIMIAVTILGVTKFRFNFASMMMPEGAPLLLAPLLVIIETVSYISRAISLGIRLAANLSAGHLLFAILASFGYTMINGGMISLSAAPILIMGFITLLEIAVALIQAYVFCLLTTIYINDTLNLH